MDDAKLALTVIKYSLARLVGLENLAGLCSLANGIDGVVKRLGFQIEKDDFRVLVRVVKTCGIGKQLAFFTYSRSNYCYTPALLFDDFQKLLIRWLQSLPR